MILGLMIANLVYKPLNLFDSLCSTAHGGNMRRRYSSANLIPIAQLHDGYADCGNPTLSYDDIRFGRAWWFGGKYAIVFFELQILIASFIVLSKGLRKYSLTAEFWSTLACCIGGVIAFTVFYLLCLAINNRGYNSATLADSETSSFNHLSIENDLDDDTPYQQASHAFDKGRRDYDSLVQSMLRVWVGLLAVAAVVWVGLRIKFLKLLSAWRGVLAASQRQWDRDLWEESNHGRRRTKRKILDIAKRGYGDEPARILESIGP